MPYCITKTAYNTKSSLREFAFVAACAIGLSGAVLSSPAAAQAYPSKRIQIVVPFTPGGANDVLARIIGQKAQEAWGQAVVIENKPGAAGNIGADVVAKSAPDGYTFLIAANGILAINQMLYDNMTFDPAKDFAPVGLIGSLSLMLVANPTLPVQSVSDLIALAKKQPGNITFGSAGNGSPQHLSAEMFASMAGVKLQNVPYKGSGPIVTDLLSGQLNVAFVPVNSAVPLVQSGKLRALGVTSAKRLSYLPDVPTIAEQGVANYQSDIWIALVAPAGTPKDILQKVNGLIADAYKLPDIREKLAAQGIEAVTSSPEEVVAMSKAETARWADIIKSAGIKP